jgi:hypothetical protein
VSKKCGQIFMIKPELLCWTYLNIFLSPEGHYRPECWSLGQLMCSALGDFSCFSATLLLNDDGTSSLPLVYCSCHFRFKKNNGCKKKTRKVGQPTIPLFHLLFCAWEIYVAALISPFIRKPGKHSTRWEPGQRTSGHGQADFHALKIQPRSPEVKNPVT